MPKSDARIDLPITEAAHVSRPDFKVPVHCRYANNAAVGSGRVDKVRFLLSKPFRMDALALRMREIIGL